MAIRNFDRFKDEMPAGFDGVFHWDFLCDEFKKATGRRIEFMDIDAMVEIKGHHLVLETKGPGVPVPGGQRIALRALWAKGRSLILILQGRDYPITGEIWYPYGNQKIMSEVTRDDLREICYSWAKWADGNPAAFQYRG